MRKLVVAEEFLLYGVFYRRVILLCGSPEASSKVQAVPSDGGFKWTCKGSPPKSAHIVRVLWFRNDRKGDDVRVSETTISDTLATPSREKKLFLKSCSGGFDKKMRRIPDVDKMQSKASCAFRRLTNSSLSGATNDICDGPCGNRY